MSLILCIDDDSDDMLLFQRSLNRAGLGCSIQQVSTLQEAEDYLSGKDRFGDRAAYPLPNLILTDLAFREGNGVDFLQWFRARPELAHIPVRCVTGSNDPHKRAQARSFGAACVSKTVDFAEVVELVREVLVLNPV
jgi:CheY-like chemotaxis protein